MKILILVPIWGRPHITKIWAKSLAHNLMENITVLTIISPDDPDSTANTLICAKYGFKICKYLNFPIGEKLNAGISYALKNFDFDYLMNLGSDDLLHPAIWGLYKPYMDKGESFFGLNKVYFYDSLSYKLGLSHIHCWGAGRMISRKILEKFAENGQFLYKNDFNSGLDTNSLENIKILLNIDYKQVETSDFPYVVDVKSNVGIGEFNIMRGHYDLVDPLILNDYFPKFIIDMIHE